MCKAAAAKNGKIRRMGRRARSGVDRTRYAGLDRRKLSYVRHRTQMICSSSIKNNAYGTEVFPLSTQLSGVDP
tara:strand:+ start:108 stop:326 length:219 start_codon:yes stop_codon:yes gene_type:complete